MKKRNRLVIEVTNKKVLAWLNQALHSGFYGKTLSEVAEWILLNESWRYCHCLERVRGKHPRPTGEKGEG
jgi:hypothetical protein